VISPRSRRLIPRIYQYAQLGRFCHTLPKLRYGGTTTSRSEKLGQAGAWGRCLYGREHGTCRRFDADSQGGMQFLRTSNHKSLPVVIKRVINCNLIH
jgi:hypothetical protein